MIGGSELYRRIATAALYLEHARHHTHSTHIDLAYTDLTAIADLALITRAHAHLHDAQPGMPASSMPEPGGKGGHSDRTGDTVTGRLGDEAHDCRPRKPDWVEKETAQIQTLSFNLEVDCHQVLVDRSAGKRGQRIEGDAKTLRFLIRKWETPPPRPPHCACCQRELGNTRYGKLCRQCGEWRAANSSQPPADVTWYWQRGMQVPQRVLDKLGVKNPRSKKTKNNRQGTPTDR